MSEQIKIAFESWYDNDIDEPLPTDYTIMGKRYLYMGWQAATAEANKRIEALEGEVAELQRENLTIHEAIEVIAGKFVEQVALSKRLREALGQLITHTLECEKRLDEFHGLGDNAGSGCSDVICNSKQALSATPAESLQAFENSVIEKCANAIDEMVTVYTNNCDKYKAIGDKESTERNVNKGRAAISCAEVIRALKEVKW